MSTTIDQRVVEMRFDNAQFERNISQSTSSLEKLKQALKFDNVEKNFNAIENAAKGLNLSSVTESIQTVSSSFSALESIANGVFARIGWDIAGWVQKWTAEFSKFSLFGQSGAGWEKYGDLTESTQTIVAAGYAIGDVETALERLNWYTDETSYNFTDMANNIGKFTAQGVDLETAATAMQGISNWAARSGQHAAEAGRAMYNLSQALAVGSVKLIDWKSIENANMSTKEFKQTAIDTAVAMGTLEQYADGTFHTIEKGTKVDFTTFTSTLSEAWFTSDVLLATLNKYGNATNELYEIAGKTGLTATQMLQALDSYEEGTNEWAKILDKNGDGYTSAENFGKMLENLAREENKLGLESFRMAQEALTFGQAMDAVADAASTSWMNIFNKLFGTFEDARGLWTNVANDLYDIFVEPVNDLLNFITRSFDSGFSQVESVLEEVGISSDDLQNAILDIADASGISSKKIREDIESGAKSLYDMFTDPSYIKWGWDENLVQAAVDKITSGTANGFKDAGEAVKEYGDLVNAIIRGNYGNGEARIKALTDAGYDYAKVQDLVNKKLAGIEVTEQALNDAELLNIELTEEQLAQYERLKDENDDLAKDYLRALNMVTKRSNRDLLAEGIHNSLVGIANVGFIVRDVFSQIFEGPASSFVDGLISRFNTLSTKFAEITDAILENEDLLSGIASIINGLFSVIGAGFGVVKSVFGAIKDSIKGLFNNTKLGKKSFLGIHQTIERMSNALKSAKESIDNFAIKVRESEFIKGIVEAIAGALYLIYTNVKNVIDFIDSHLPEGANLFERLGKAIENAYQKFKDNETVKKYLGPLIEAAEKLVEKFPEAFNTVKTELGNFFDYLDEKTEGGTNILGGLVSILDDVKTAIMGLFNFNDIDWENFFGGKEAGDNKLWWENLLGAFKGMFKSGGEEGKEYAGVLDGIANGYKAIKEAASGSFTIIKGWGSAAVDKLTPIFEYFGNMDLSGAPSLVAISALSGGFLKLSSGFENLGKAALQFTNPIQELKNILAVVKDVAKQYKAQIKANTFRTIAIGIAALAASLLILLGAVYFLSKNVNSIKELGPGLLIVGGLLVFMAGFFWAISAINKKYGGIQNAVSIAAIFLSMSLSLLVLIGALKLLTMFSDSVKLTDLFKFAFIIAAMTVIVHALRNGGTGVLKAIGTLISLIAFSAFLMTFAISLFVLDGVLSNLKNPAATIITIVISLIALMTIMGLSTQIKTSAMLSLLALPLTLILVGVALEELASLRWERINKKLLSIVLVVLSLITVYAILNMIPVNGGNWRAGIAVVGIAASLLLVAQAIKMIMEIPINTKDPYRIYAVLAFIVLTLGILAIAAGYLSESMGGEHALQASTSIIALAVALLIISGAMMLLSAIDTGKIIGAAAALLIVMAGIAVVVSNSENATNQVGTIMALAALIAVLVLAFYALQAIELPMLAKAGAAIGLMMAVLGGFLYFTSYFNGGMNNFSMMLGGVLVIAAIAAALVAVAELTKDVSWGKLLDIAVSIGLVLVAFGAMFALIGQFGTGATLPLLALAAVFIGFGAALWITSKAIEGFISTLGNMDLSQVEALGIKIGALVPSIISGFLIGLFHAIPQIGMGIYTAFKTGLQYLSLVWTDVKSKASEFWNSFVEGVKEIDWSELANTIWQKITGALGWAWQKVQDFANWLGDAAPEYNSDPMAVYAKHAGVSGESAAREFSGSAGKIIAEEGLINEASVIEGLAKTTAAAESGSEELGTTIAKSTATGFSNTFWPEIQNVIGGGEGGLDLSTFLGVEGGAFDLTSVADFSSNSYITNFTGMFENFDFGQTGRDVGSDITSGTEETANASIFSGIGQKLMDGLTETFNALAGYNAGYEVGAAAVQGTADATEVRSPSRKFYEIGEYCVKGLVNAVQHLSGVAAGAGYDLGTEVLVATSESLAGMYSILEGGEMIMPSVGLVGGSLNQNGLYGSTYGLNGGSYGYNSPQVVRPLGATSTTTTNAPVFNIYQQPGQDPEALARIINRELGRMYVR